MTDLERNDSAVSANRRNRKARRLLLVLVAFAMVVASCGSDDEVANSDDQAPAAGSSANTDADGVAGADVDTDVDADADAEGNSGDGTDEAGADAEFPVTIDTDEGEVVIAEQPTAIVSLSPTSTEMAFAIGAGDQITAVDNYSNFPPEAPEGTLDGFSPDLEAILAAGPDLVLAAGIPEDIAAGITGAGVPVLILPAATSFDDTYDQIAQLGIATGQVDGAAATAATMRSDIDEMLADLPEADEPVKVFHEIDDSFYTATSESFIGQVYSSLGLVNIADSLDDGTGFPLIDGESIIAGDPGIIVFTSQATYDADDIAARPGWDTITAVANGRIVQVDADIASRWGPRIVEFMRVIVDTLAPA